MKSKYQLEELLPYYPSLSTQQMKAALLSRATIQGTWLRAQWEPISHCCALTAPCPR